MREIVQDGAEVLRATAPALPEALFGTPELFALLKDMEEALDAQPEGVALAAPQVGVSYRVFIVRKDRTVLPPPVSAEQPTAYTPPPPEVDVYINPEIIKSSRKRKEADEGCLSVRHIYGTTKRHERVTLRARRPDGTSFERGAGGLMAQIFQHEVDHLNGILFIDHAEHLLKVTEPTAPHE